jgi:hypothetical protein
VNLNGFSVTAKTSNGGVAMDVPRGDLLHAEFATKADGGYYYMTLVFAGRAADLLQWYYLLSKRIILHGPSGQVAFDGWLEKIDMGGVDYDLTYYYNAVKVLYSSDIGVRADTGWATDSDGIARYGRKEVILSKAGLTSTAAESWRDLTLYFSQRVLGGEPFPIPRGRPSDILMATLSVYGGRSLLKRKRWVQSNTGNRDTGTQVQDIIADTDFYDDAVDWLVYQADGHVDTTSISISRYRPDQNLTMGEEIDRLTKLGYSDASDENKLIFFQCWDDRTCWINQLSSGNFPNADYYEQDGRVFLDSGGQVPLWLVKADKVILTPGAQPLGYGAFSDELETPKGWYILGTKYNVSTGVLTIEPAGWREYQQLIARFVGAGIGRSDFSKTEPGRPIELGPGPIGVGPVQPPPPRSAPPPSRSAPPPKRSAPPPRRGR